MFRFVQKPSHLLAAAPGAWSTGHAQRLVRGTSYWVFSYPTMSKQVPSNRTEPITELSGDPAFCPNMRTCPQGLPSIWMSPEKAKGACARLCALVN